MAKQRGTDTESVLRLGVDGKQAQTSINELRDTYYKLNPEIQNMKREDKPQLYDEKVRNIQKVDRAWKSASAEIRGATRETKTLRGEMADMAKQAVSGLGIAGGFYALKQGLEMAISKNAEL